MKAISINKFREDYKNCEYTAYLDIEQTKVIESIKINGNSASVVFYGYASSWDPKKQVSVMSIYATIYVL